MRENGIQIYSELAKKVGADYRTVKKIIEHPDGYASKPKSGPKKKISNRETVNIRRIVNKHKGWVSAKQVNHELGLKVSSRTVQRRLKDIGFSIQRAIRCPPLTDRHKIERLKFAEKYLMQPKSFWDRVIISDEKRWLLDGPDGYDKYWAAEGSKPQTRIRRQNGGGSFMIWLGMFSKGTTELAYCTNNVDRFEYIDILEEYLLPHLRGRRKSSWIFQQDGAAAHRANDVTKFLVDNKIKTMSWPARSPDLSPIENLWAWLTQQVYAGGRQYASLNELKDAVEGAIRKIPTEFLTKLMGGMKRRLEKVIAAKGEHIKM